MEKVYILLRFSYLIHDYGSPALKNLQVILTQLFRKIAVFVSEYWERRDLVKAMTIRDFKSRYIGSAFGLAWAIIQPLAMMSILYFVFQYGLKTGQQDGKSFIAWFFSAIIAWNFFQDVLGSTANVYAEYSYVIKKMNFRLALLPLVKILSCLFIHFIFIIIILIVVFVTTGSPGWYFFQIFYYLFAMMFFLFGVTWFLSTLNVLLKDVGQMISIILQFGFWATPIAWPLSALPKNLHYLAKLNPIYYITEGYRKSLVLKVPIWEESFYQTLYFWGLSFGFLFLGFFVFRRLKSHFADVL